MPVIVRSEGTIVDSNAADIDFLDGITVTQIAPGVVQIVLATGGIVTVMLDDLAVTTAKLADLAVTAAKLAADSITTVKILDDAVTPPKLDRAYVEGPFVGAACIEEMADASATSGTSVAAGASVTALTFDVILPANGVTYDCRLDSFVAMFLGASRTSIRAAAVFRTTADVVILASDFLRNDSPGDIVTVSPALTLLGRSNETLRCGLDVLHGAAGSGVSSYWSRGLYFLAIPRT